MDWLWLVFGTVGAFAMLSLMGSERQKRVNAIQASKPAASNPEPSEAPLSV